MSVLSAKQWCRHGRGKSFQFFAEDSEMFVVLLNDLPIAYAPYHLFGIYTVKDGRNYKEKFIKCELNDFLSLRQKGIWEFFYAAQYLLLLLL